MSYDISFKVKVEGKDIWIPVGECNANITWNVRQIITESTGLPWNNEANNGYVRDVIPFIKDGIRQIKKCPKKYRAMNDPGGWGTADGVLRFFQEILDAWDNFCEDYYTRDLADVATFWIE